VTPRLWEYGADMPGFLQTFPPAANLPYLPDVARLELAIRHSYHAADAAPVAAAALALPPERLLSARLSLSPALRVLRSNWPLHAIWHFHHGGPQPQAGAQDVAVFRPGFDPFPVALPGGAAEFLTALSLGRTVAQAIDAAPSDHPLAETLTLLLTHGAIVALQESP
jgi:hypothetical protein